MGADKEYAKIAQDVIKGLGGKENIISMACVLRRLPSFKSDLENTQSNTAIAISTGVVFMMIAVIAKLLPLV
ncbi:hypothetical protein ABEW19_28245 [Paenibacillus illinoisensis]|uniref:hypothetical protein n=1 Tax=Paenibacillus illinoisensis TaxID=59845 RepID=UPI003D2AE732